MMMGRVLIIDDDIPFCWLLERILREDHVVEIANDGMEAWECLRKNRPDLIISDIEVPPMKDFEFLENFRNSGLFKDIPFIILTSKSDSETTQKGIGLGANAYLIKPFEPESLRTTVRNALMKPEKQISIHV